MSNKYRNKIDLKKYYLQMYSCKEKFKMAAKERNVGNALFWSNHISFWRNQIKGLQNAN